MKKTSRRTFIGTSTALGMGALVAAPQLNKLFAADKRLLAGDTGFEQQPLAYGYNALEPSIDGLTMEIHYTKHAAAYCKNLKEAAAAEKVDTNKPLEEVLKKISRYSVKMRNNAGGHYNHELFWKSLTPKAGTAPSGRLAQCMNESFGSAENFMKEFSEAARSRFGSGWAWLIKNGDKKLIIASTPNQDNPLMDVCDVQGQPVLGLDVWEHAYYLKYQNRRAEYIENFWKVVNWDFVSERFSQL